MRRPTARHIAQSFSAQVNTPFLRHIPQHALTHTCEGLWGIVRHPNYVGSITYTWAACMTCGSGHLFPYTEAILVAAMCIHRCFRDEAKCKAKYGKAWDEYCLRVKWRLIPGVF